MRFLLVVCVVFSAGCSSIGVCNFSLSEAGWERVEGPPSELLDEHNKSHFWFSNDRGDYLSSSEVLRRDYCGNVYRTYRKKSDGGYEHDHIVCME